MIAALVAVSTAAHASSTTGQAKTGASSIRASVTYFVASGLAPGDTVEHTLELQLTAREPLATITLTTTSNDPSLLVTDHAHGLHVAIDTCDRPNAEWWQEFGTSAAPSSSCVGTTAVVLVSRPILGTDIPLDNVNVDGVTHLRISVTLPATADNRFQGLTHSLRVPWPDRTTRRRRPLLDRRHRTSLLATARHDLVGSWTGHDCMRLPAYR